MAKKPAKSTGKAAWMTGTTFIVLVLPLLIAMDREYQLNELDLPERSLLGVPIHNWTRHSFLLYFLSGFCTSYELSQK